MAKNSTKVALIYDFDETLSIDYMQSFGLIQTLGMKPDTFWKKANLWSANNNADQITGTMYYFMKTAKENQGKSILVNLSGRGDKDIDFILKNYPIN